MSDLDAENSVSTNPDNATAVEAISERLAEVTSLAEQLDHALRGAQQDCALAPSSSPSIKKIFDGAVTTSSAEEWYSNPKPTRPDDLKSDEEFLTASEYTAQSRSESFHTASECGHLSPWWEFDKSGSDREDLHKERLVLGVGLPDLPNPKSVIKPSPEPPPGKIVHEVTETTHLKVQHSHTFGVASFVLTSETVKDGKSVVTDIGRTTTQHSVIEKKSLQEGAVGGPRKEVADGKETVVPVLIEEQEPILDEDLLRRMKESGDWLQLKILEVDPELTVLGETLAEALELQKAHDEVLLQLQSKQSPVEELLRQADQLISTQRPRAEVYAAMAESLGRAWKDVNAHLELRRLILELNVAYHRRADECYHRIGLLEAACSEGEVPIEIDAVKGKLTELHEMRRSVLEALMAALQEGNSLLARLKELAAEGTLDSRPERIKISVRNAISQVERWLEALHDRRRLLELSWQTRKTQLEQCLALALLASDLRELEDVVKERRSALASSYQLGDSQPSAEVLEREHRVLLPEAKELQERAIKITKATEQLLQSGCFAGEQATAQAYAVLESVSDYLNDLEIRETLLQRVIEFFKLAFAALTKLNEIEIQLKTSSLSPLSHQLAELHARLSDDLQQIPAPAIQEGYALLDLVGQGPSGTEGIQKTINQLENRKIELTNLCTAHHEENRRAAEALNGFFEKQNEINSWLTSIAEAFLQGHQDMGSVLPMARDFFELHAQLLSDVQIKGTEINSLLLTLPPILEFLKDEQRRNVDSKVEALHDKWINIKNMLEARLDLANLYVKFHTQAVELDEEMTSLEDSVKKRPDGLSENEISNLEEKWLSLKPLHNKLKTTGQQFISEASKATSDPWLDSSRACVCVEALLDKFANRQLTVTESWQTWLNILTERRELLTQLERTMTVATKTIELASNLESQIYPIITSTNDVPLHIISDLEEKLNYTVLPEIKRVQTEIDTVFKETDTYTRSPLTKENLAQVSSVHNNLQNYQEKLQQTVTEYEILLQTIIAFFKNVSELEKTVTNLKNQYANQTLPTDLGDVEHLVNEHEASKRAVLEMFRFAQNEADRIIVRISKQEPFEAGQSDARRIIDALKRRKDEWEASWEDRKAFLEQHRQLCQFNSDLHQISDTLNDLSHQLAAVKGQYGESLSGAKSTSVAFVYFEKTIELLEQRIAIFVQTAENMLSEQHVNSPHIERELRQLQNRWADFLKQVKDTRRLIDLAIQYFQLVEEADEWFKEGSRLLVTIARKATTVKLPEEATQLLNEVEMFLKPGEIKQDERIMKISELAYQLYGQEKSQQVNKVQIENREMLDSFTVISNELNTLAANLKKTEEERERMKREQLEADKNLAAAKAEAMAAQAAAAAAEEARKAAEAAATALRDAKPLTAQTSETTTQTMEIIEMVKQTIVPVKEVVEVQTAATEVQQAEVTGPPMEAPVFVELLTNANIQEGTRFTFECRVTGTPKPTVSWFKDGIPIDNNPDYQTTFNEHGICTLTIEETFAEDSARFTCKAINEAGSAETAATLSVKETEPDEELTPPSFLKMLVPASAKEGSTFQFECVVQGNPLPTVQWFKDNDCIDNSPDYIITYNNGVAILKFEEVFLEDKAEYTCKATNQLGIIQSTASLSVEPLEPTESPAFVIPLSNVMARAGQKIKLECEVSGLPEPTVSWSHDGKLIKETTGLKLQRQPRDDTESDRVRYTLTVSEAFPKDAGLYTATACNLAGEAVSACNVTVKGRLPTETSDSEFAASDMEPIKPAIHLPLKDQAVFEGKRVRLDCVIVGQPEPEVIWYHDDRPVKESSDFQLLFQGDRCSLIIQEAYLDDAGHYKVVAINSAGEASSSCSLSVTPVTGDTERATRVPVETVVPKGAAPEFIKLLSDVLVSEGDKVVLDCCVVGDPKPGIKWFLNNEEVSSNEHLEFSQGDDGNVRLSIEHVTPNDKGVYTVKASNPFGEVKCFSQLIVKSLRPPETAPIVHEEKLQPPSFKELFSDRLVPQSESVKFECIVVGKPTPKVKWLFNDFPVSGKDFLVSTSGDRHVLTIPSAALIHQGKITCLAENEAGRSSCVASLKIELPQQQIVPIDMTGLQTSEVKSSFSQQVFTSSSKQVFSSSSSTIGGQEPQVEVHSMSSQSQQSMKQVDQQAPEVIQAHKFEEFHQKNQEEPSVSQKSFVSVSKDGFETKKQITSSETPVQIQKPVRKSIAPRFVSPVIGKIVDQGADVILEGILDGHPAPDVKWLKNGSDLQPKEGSINISWQLNHARLELKNVGVKDAGKYTCTASNEVGSATCTADLVVKKTIFPPVFGRRLQAQVVKKGDRVVMEVEVTGTPEPTVTWYKDDVPIANIDLPDFRFKTQGNNHSFIIEKAGSIHTGKYMVRATNSGGEAQSIADFAVFEPTPDTMVEVVKTLVFEDIKEQQTIKSAAAQSVPTSVPSEVKVPITIEPPKPAPISPQPPWQSVISSSSTVTESRHSEKSVSFKTDRVESPLFQILQNEKQAPEPIIIEKKESEISKETFEEYGPVKIHQVPVDIEEAKEESNIDTASIPISSALDFFKTKLEEQDKPWSPPPQQAPPEGAYTKFVDINIAEQAPEPQEIVEVCQKTVLPVRKPGPPPPLPKPKPMVQAQAPEPVKEVPTPKVIDEVPPPKPAYIIPSPKPEEPKFVPLPPSTFKPVVFESSDSKISAFKSVVPPPTLIKPIQQSFESSTMSSSSFTPLSTSAFQSYQSSSFSKTESKSFSAFSSNASQQLFEEYNLVPEPPPEIGYMPKSEGTAKKTREDLHEKVKLLEESHKQLPSFDIPAGAVRIFPVPKPTSETKSFVEERVQMQSFQQSSISKKISQSDLTDSAMPKPIYKAPEPAPPPVFEVPKPEPPPIFEVPKPTPPPVFEIPKPAPQPIFEVPKPAPPPVFEIPKPAPAPAFVAPKPAPPPVFETPKTVAAPIFKPLTPIAPPVFKAPEPIQPPIFKAPEPIPPLILKPGTPPEFVEIETQRPKPVTPSFTPVSPVFRPQADIITRPLSPRPSAEAIQMEKLWIPQRPLTPEIPSALPPKEWGEMKSSQYTRSVSAYSTLEKPAPRPHSAMSYTQEKPPSAEGLAMDKKWTSKRVETQMKKSWPPQQPEAEKIIPPWTASTETISKVESFSKTSESYSKKSETHISHETKPLTPVFKPIQPSFQPIHVAKPITYVSESVVSHFTNVPEQTFQQKTQHTEFKKSEMFSEEKSVIEESTIKPSEAKKIWPPVKPDDYDLKAPSMVKKIVPSVEPLMPRPVSVQDITDEVFLIPGTPPELAFAEPPKEPRRQSFVEAIEQELVQNLEKEPAKVPPGAVRIAPPPPREKSREKSLPPPPLPPRKEQPLPAPSVPVKPIIDSKPFERFPDLEPFPYKPDPQKPKQTRLPPPCTPSKFIKGDFAGSDYESDIDSRIKTKWGPSVSDTEEPSYRRVRPPSSASITRSRSIEPEPLPPSKFERPPQIVGPPRPMFDIETTKKELKKEIVSEKITKTKQIIKPESPKPVFQPIIRPTPKPKRKTPSPPLKPGTPPEYVQAEPTPPKPKSGSPKLKQKIVIPQPESGYMADTDEPFSLYRKTLKSEEMSSSRTEYKQTRIVEQNSYASEQKKVTVQSSQQFSPIVKPQFPSKVHHHKHHEQHRTEKKHFTSTATSASKKEMVSPALVKSVTIEKTSQRDDRDSSLEPFPFKPEPPRPKRGKGPPPPSPSKFVKGEFRESDYESDYADGVRIPPLWRPTEPDTEPTYKPVRPVLTPSGRHSQISTGNRTPTPPTEFDNPPQFGGPPRPKFQPIEKHKQTIKVDEISRSASQKSSQVLIKPKPVAAKPVTEIIIATPAVKQPDVYIKPGSPPEMSYAPPPKQTRYYKSTTSTPYHNATATETSNIINFNESTENAHRVVNIQQTTRIIKFGDSKKEERREEKLQPFPFKPEPEKPRRKTGPPPPTPTKFRRGEFKESDYESEVEMAKIKPKWIPGDSDNDDPKYRKVRPPPPARSASVPITQQRVLTPMEFDTQPPQMPSKISLDVSDFKSTRKSESIKKTTELHQQISQQQQQQKQITKPKVFRPPVVEQNNIVAQIKPGSPPEYGYIPGNVAASKATKMASKHMDEMTHTFKSKAQQFVNDIMTDVKTKSDQKPILKTGVQQAKDSDAQVYREESRAAQHGTKHIDPDTGLIYFKYDFGYEFGIIFPGEGGRKNGEIPQPKKTVFQPPKRYTDIEVPVLHETTKPVQNGQCRFGSGSRKQHPPSSHSKNVKWEPTSESEMSEWEDTKHKKRNSLPQPPYITIPTTPSPMSLSPSLPSLSPRYGQQQLGARLGGETDTPTSIPSTPGSGQERQRKSDQPSKPPVFITPLRDIAVMSGQTARFECIAQAEPSPKTLWSKNGSILYDCQQYQIQFRNGVCRLTIPQAFPADAGQYACTASNHLGSISSSATLQVTGERRSSYI